MISFQVVGLLLWLITNYNYVECGMGCSFSTKNWCGYTNVFDGDTGPQWRPNEVPAHQSTDNNRHQNPRIAVQGSHPMEMPPNGDHYLETGPTQDNRFAETFAELLSPPIQVNNTPMCLYFSYHNRIPMSLIPTLVVLRRSENISDHDVILAEYYSLSSQKWFEAEVALPEGEYSIVFSGRNYNSRTITGGHVAITNIAIMEGSCAQAVPDWLRSPGDCGFENDLEQCGYTYTNDTTVRLLQLLAESLSTFERSQRDQRRPPSDRFFAMTAQFYEIANQGNKARLLSPEIFIKREGCIYMWYYNSVQSKQDNDNVLNIIRIQNSDENIIFRLPIPKSQRDRWYQLNGALPKGSYRLILEVVYTSDFGENDYVGFDNIEIFNKSCSDAKSTADVCDADIPTGKHLCKNEGSCISMGKKSFRCICADGFYGKACEHRYVCTENSSPCHNGGTCLPDGKVDFHCQCAPGFEGKTCEQVKQCGSPELAFKQARLLSDSTLYANATYGSVVRLQCKEGWYGVEELTATCNAQGEWQTQGRCLWVNCGPPPTFFHAQLLDISNTSWNGQAKYKCQDGMIPVANSHIFTCVAQMYHMYYGGYNLQHLRDGDTISGVWQNIYGNVQCRNIPNCGSPPTLPNSNMTVTSQLMNGIVTYRCIDGYEFNVNLTVVAASCSEEGSWKTRFPYPPNDHWIDIRHSGEIFQCLHRPACGPPPEVQFAEVSFIDIGINSTANYTCQEGYHLIGSESATCWKISDDRRTKWVDWIFVPKCEKRCSVKEGRRGNFSVVKFQLSRCFRSGYETFSTSLKCEPPVSYSLKRKPERKMQEKNIERLSFQGSELCIAEMAQRVRLFGNSVLYNNTKCQSICIQSPIEIRDIVVYDELSYVRTQVHQTNDGWGQMRQQMIVPSDTTRKQTLMRYVVLQFA